MFESDDFDQVLSQFDFPELPSSISKNITAEQPSTPLHVLSGNSIPPTEEAIRPVPKKPKTPFKQPLSPLKGRIIKPKSIASKDENNTSQQLLSPKHAKRKMINSFFDTSVKRKFPGPAGLLTGTLEESKDDNICQMELLSQDLDFSQTNLRLNIYESPIWTRLLQDVASWDLGSVDNIKSIKQQALSGNLRRRKAQLITAFLENVDRSATDPLVILRDSSANIKCTLHRDAWSAFSPYIVSEYCAFVLIKPTVLTTGSAFKKHYLNITLSNIFAIYSSAVLEDDDEITLPEGYRKVYEEDYTIIRTDRQSNQNQSDLNISQNSESVIAENNDLLEGLDSSIFLDELF